MRYINLTYLLTYIKYTIWYVTHSGIVALWFMPVIVWCRWWWASVRRCWKMPTLPTCCLGLWMWYHSLWRNTHTVSVLISGCVHCICVASRNEITLNIRCNNCYCKMLHAVYSTVCKRITVYQIYWRNHFVNVWNPTLFLFVLLAEVYRLSVIGLEKSVEHAKSNVMFVLDTCRPWKIY